MSEETASFGWVAAKSRLGQAIVGILLAAVVTPMLVVSMSRVAGPWAALAVAVAILSIVVGAILRAASAVTHLPIRWVAALSLPPLIFLAAHPPSATPVPAVAAQVPVFGIGHLPGGHQVSNCHMLSPAPEVVQQWRPEQVGNAQAIVQVTTIGRGLPPRAAQIAVATAIAESGLENLPYGDRDSLGLFQQRPSQGWGSPAQVMDPAHATNSFLDRMVQIPGWPERRLGEVAQDVQRSAHASGDIYDAEAGPADGLVQALVACS